MNDVTQLNPIEVDQVITPTAVEEIVSAVKNHSGPISVGGGRYSMGGQTATEGAIQIDMRQFNKIVHFSREDKEITVQAGARWRQIQEFVDPYDLSVRIMQTYANFTVGGSLSVNVHGRYVGQGPLVLSVKSIRVVLPNGQLVEASPKKNREIFYGVIGGYGALGVIVEATLSLVDNVPVERRSQVMPLSEYRNYFFREIRHDPKVIFHNADIYPDAYDTVRVTSFVETDKPVTVPERVQPNDASYWLDRQVFSIISEWPFGKAFRQHIVDPLLFRDERVEWRNYEASYDARELEPVSRDESTYVLQEYFVPVARLEHFVALMGETLNRHKVNVINVSIRHAEADPGTLLAWAREEVFALVLYYKQGTSDADRRHVAVWTREMIDALTSVGGAYYLPYQIHATRNQLRAAYPNADAFFALKRRLDPTNKFRNKLWDAYYRPELQATKSDATSLARADLKEYENYQRDESQTYLTLPEWFLVYSPDEYAQFINDKPPAEFPYFSSIGQFWGYYRDAYEATKEKYGFNWGYHAMVFVIGSSFTVENAVKGLYENTIGRVTEWLRGNGMTEEDRYAARVAQEYVDFIRVDPWYEFDFAARLRKLWAETDLFGSNLIRKWERKIYLSAEYAAKAQYAMLIKLGTKAAYADADAEMLALAENVSTALLEHEPRLRVLRRFDDGSALLSLPRYEEFRDCAVRLAREGVRFKEIAGNSSIMVTALVPRVWSYDLAAGKVRFERPILTHAAEKRIAIEVPVTSLHQILRDLGGKGYMIEHIYDY